MKTQPSAIDLFCGAGGLSEGLQRAGFEVCWAVDQDAVAVETYRENHGSHVIEANICETNTEEDGPISNRVSLILSQAVHHVLRFRKLVDLSLIR